MILIPHIVVAAAIAAKINFLPLALILAFLSHYFLDFLPHIEYSIYNINITNKDWRKNKKDFLKIGTDLFVGLIFIVLMRQITKTNYYYLGLAGFLGILPDIINSIYLIYPKNILLKWHNDLHQKIHILKYKKISNKWRIFSQTAVVLLAFLFLF